MITKHGNLPLGQISKLLVSIIGRDAALSAHEKYKEKNAPLITGKDLDRMYEEEERSFTHFKPRENTSALELERNFSQFLEEEYKIPGNIKSLFNPYFFGVYRDALRALIPYEKETKDITLHLLHWFLGYLGCKIQDSDSTEIHTFSKDSVKRLLGDTFEVVFNDVFNELKISKTDFYDEAEKFYKEKTLGDFPQALKRDIAKCCKNNSSDPWAKDWGKFKAILDFIMHKGKKELVHRLIGQYLLKNAEAAL